MEVKGKRQAKSHNYKIHKSTQQASMEKQLYPIHFFFFCWGVVGGANILWTSDNI